ncbi:MAG: hypothetical protein IJ960_06825 [Oscillospiraceae bacterium]|nr:hypothetical protein [Oscillospiraceae bacterium]
MKYQMICPKCKHEFAYDNGEIDARISYLSHQVTTLNLKLQEHRTLPKEEQYARTAWWRRTKAELAKAQKELAEAKAFRKVADQQTRRFIHDAFCHLVREEIGDEAYIRLKRQAEADTEAYTMSGLMRHEYTRANYKSNVVSVSKVQGGG